MNICINKYVCGGLAINLSTSFTIHTGVFKFHSCKTPKYLKLPAKKGVVQNRRRMLPFLIKVYSCCRRICKCVEQYDNKWAIKQSLNIYIQLYA